MKYFKTLRVFYYCPLKYSSVCVSASNTNTMKKGQNDKSVL